MMQGCCRNEQVHVRDEVSRASQIGSDASEELHYWPGERKRFELIEKLTIRRELRLGIRIAEGALENLSVRNDAHPHTFLPHVLERMYGTRVAAEDCDQYVRVEQMLHGRSIGLVPSSRQR